MNQGAISSGQAAVTQYENLNPEGQTANSNWSGGGNVPSPAGQATIPEPEPSMPERAAIPVSVGGASLTCTVPDPAQFVAECLAVLPSGQAANLSPTAVFFIEGQSKLWHSVAFAKGMAAGSWLITLPYNVENKSFGIAINDVNLEGLMDWVLNPADPVESLVGNGGFEAVRFTNSQDYATQFIDATNATPSIWRVISKTPSCLNLLEISATEKDPNAQAPEGTQWTELDSSCTVDRVNGERAGNNIILYQDIKLELDSFYELTFQYRRRKDNGSLQKVKVSFGETVVLQKEVHNEVWVTHKYVFKATSKQARLQFEEEGNSDDGVGTLLDDVVLTPFGTGVSP